MKRNRKTVLIALALTALTSTCAAARPQGSEEGQLKIASAEIMASINPEHEWEDVEIETVAEPESDFVQVEEEEQAQQFFNVPLSEDLQEYIFQLCKEHNIAPGIIMAMIERESSFKADAVGDKGNSEGLMQIQKRWCQEMMDKLGCQNLLDPYQNVTVGINLVAELKDKNADFYWVLMAYNGGETYATRKLQAEDFSEYAVEVVARASELNNERGTK